MGTFVSELGFLILLVNVFTSSTQPQPSDITSRQDGPVIKLAWTGPDWTTLSGENGKRAFYAPKGDDFFVYCQAPFPIQWKISGIITPAEIVKVQPPTRNLSSKTFKIAINIFFREAHEYEGLAASATIVCESIENSDRRDEISVFVRGNKPLVEPDTNIVTDSTVIPCLTTDPTQPTKLYKLNADVRHANMACGTGSEVHVTDVTYHTTAGFRFTNNAVFEGNYVCKKEGYTVAITAATLLHPTSSETDEGDSVNSGSRKAFSDESIEIKCTSKSKPVKFVFHDTTKVNVEMLLNKKHDKVVKLSVRKGVNGLVKGKVECHADGQQLLKEWTFEFIDPPSLYLDNFEGEVDCISAHSPKMVQTVRCINSIHCAFMRHCLKDISRCNFKKQKQFYANKDTFCWVEKLQTGKPCASVPYSHYNGVAQCKIDGLIKTWEYFVSLDLLKYSDWRDAPKHELVRMDPMPSVLYTDTDKVTRFVCTASAYLFADSLGFEIEYRNGTKQLLETDGKLVNVTNPSSESPRKIDEFNVVGILDIKLPVDTVGISCIAPWWNSTELLMTTHKFETKQVGVPKIRGGGGKVMKEFYIGEKNQRLTCPAGGTPQPIYKWLYNGENVGQQFPELRATVDSNGVGYLEIPEVHEKYSGEYQCLAANDFGVAGVKYSVEIPDVCRYRLECQGVREAAKTKNRQN